MYHHRVQIDAHPKNTMKFFFPVRYRPTRCQYKDLFLRTFYLYTWGSKLEMVQSGQPTRIIISTRREGWFAFWLEQFILTIARCYSTVLYCDLTFVNEPPSSPVDHDLSFSYKQQQRQLNSSIINICRKSLNNAVRIICTSFKLLPTHLLSLFVNAHNVSMNN